ncbi:MAG TPA: serine hydrolase domain-containing protein [Candidatus Limnocylindria bacterium]|nr:serine hydrolase domain-containing protein [Candidatus Limnocylindria bacterium]
MSLAEPARAVADAAAGSLFTACAVRVERRGTVDQFTIGTLCPDPDAGPDAPCAPTSLFDLASLTKLATTAVVLALVRDRTLDLAMPFRQLVPDFRGHRKDEVTLSHVLTHTAGLMWWLPLWRETKTLDEAVWRAAQEPLAQDLGTFRYSDLGYIMLTKALADVSGHSFAALLRGSVLGPIEATSCDFGPRPPGQCVATERDAEPRMRRLRGEVHDENAFGMGGVAGHAGLFGTAADVAAIARVYRDGAVVGNELARLARSEHVREDNVRRGLGLALRAPRDAMVGRFFSESAYGHTGFTGTSLWIDPATDLTVILLTNRVYFGRANDDAMYRFRIAVHEAVSRPFAEAAA